MDLAVFVAEDCKKSHNTVDLTLVFMTVYPLVLHNPEEAPGAGVCKGTPR